MENQKKELNDRVWYIYKTNSVASENMDKLTQKHVTVMEQNQSLQHSIIKWKGNVDSLRKEKDDLIAKNASQEYLIEFNPSCDKCGERFTEQMDMKYHLRTNHVSKKSNAMFAETD